MTRRVLASPRRPPKTGIAEVDDWIDKYLSRYVADVFSDLRYLIKGNGTFTPVIGGSTTAGTYEIATNYSYFTRIGDLVFVSLYVVLDSSLTGGGSGSLEISGLPFNKQTNHWPVGVAFLVGLDVNDAALQVVAMFDAITGNSTTLRLREVTDNATATAMDISDIAADDQIAISIAYLTDDP